MSSRSLALFALLLCTASSLGSQGRGDGTPAARNPLADPIPREGAPAYIRTTAPSNALIQRIWDEGMTRSQAMTFAQQLTDPLGQRLTGSPQMDAAQDWLVRTYAALGVTARKERYGTWNGWSRGVTHVDLIAPRVRSLEAYALAWSPPTGTSPVEGEVVTYPANVTTAAEFDAWLPNVRGKIFLMSVPRLSCRSSAQWAEFGTPEEISRVNAAQAAMQAAFSPLNAAMNAGGSVWTKLKDAGAVAVFTFGFSGYPGIQKVFGSQSQTLPSFAIGCEDYGLLFRMAQNGQGPRVRASTDSQILGERPVFNVVAEIRGRELPNEYVVLSAHFDSWSASSGATDNATGTVTMLEAMRILKQVYPNPRRTIIVGHWSGEEQGLNGSRAFTEDHPEVISGMQAVFNQDNGTGRVVSMTAGPFPGAATRIEGYLGEIPREITQWIRWSPTSGQATGGTDHASFVCHRVPGINLGALSWDYSLTTWHTDRDTFDKIVESDLKNNATLTAMLVYLASEDPARIPRDILNPLPATGFGQNRQDPGQWRDCGKAQRQSPPITR